MKKSITLLYVEDDKAAVAFVKVLFKKYERLSVTFASDGKEGLTLYKQHTHDIVITDMQMPNMGGFTLIERIREHNPSQLVAMVSAMEHKNDCIRAINLRIHHFLQKPLRSQTFEPVIDELIGSVEQKRKAALNHGLLKQYKNAVDETSIFSKSDLKGRITYVNKKFCEISKYGPRELIGKPHSILRHPDVPKEVFQDMWDTIQNKKTWKGKIKNLAKDGSEYIVDATIVPVLDRNNTIIEYIGLRNDVTELEQYKELLQVELDTTSSGLKEKVHTLAEYERAIDESNAFTRTDTKGRLTYVNDKFCEINGYSRDELLGKPHSVVRHPDMPKAFFKRLWETIKAKKIWKGIIKNKTKSGKATYMDTTIIPMLDAGGRLVEYMSIRHEVTELIGLQHEIEDTQKEVVYTMGAIGESRSKETGNHVKRVAEYSKVLAKLWGMEEQQAQMLRQASPMHDIGKVAIPDAILNKPGKLDAKEWKTMQTHAKLGYNMLKHSKRKLLQTAAIVAHEHHERWEGGGYPRNLRGEDIHIYGRITAVADVFDALGSDRCYKKAWSLDKILDLFRQERGKQFDPVLIDLFLENIDTFIQIRNRYRD